MPLVKICFVCQRQGVQACIHAESEKIEMGTLQILWNGYLAKEVDVFWCQQCGDVRLRMYNEMGTKFICGQCCKRALEVPLDVPREDQAKANTAAA